MYQSRRRSVICPSSVVRGTEHLQQKPIQTISLKYPDFDHQIAYGKGFYLLTEIAEFYFNYISIAIWCISVSGYKMKWNEKCYSIRMLFDGTRTLNHFFFSFILPGSKPIWYIQKLLGDNLSGEWWRLKARVIDLGRETYLWLVIFWQKYTYSEVVFLYQDLWFEPVLIEQFLWGF